MESLDIYKKLFSFLEKKYFENKNDDLGLLVGDMRIIDDGESADISMLKDWYGISGFEVCDRDIIYHNCIKFLKQYALRLYSIELENLIKKIEINKDSFISEII